MATEKLIVFIKAPRPGTVKTRLAKTIGPEAACAAYQTLVAATLAQLSGLTNVELRFAPDEALSEIKPWLRESWHAQPQGQGDLGQRLHASFVETFADGAQRVAITGSDCPTVTGQDIKDAWAALNTHDVVLGPAKDGGYWLIALRQPQPGLFHGINWSTDQVLRETIERAEAAGLRVRLLRELADVDTEKEWRDYLDSKGSG
jgi:rSAM/selenodomain-associated transferase 1